MVGCLFMNELERVWNKAGCVEECYEKCEDSWSRGSRFVPWHCRTYSRHTPATASFVLFTILFLGTIAAQCPDVLVSLRHFFRGLVCVFFRGDICEDDCFLHATLFEDIRCFRMSRDLSKLLTICWKSVGCYVATTLLLGYIYPSIIFNLNLCSSFGDETCEQTCTICLLRAFTFCISQRECMQVNCIEENWRRVSLCDLKFWQPWVGQFFDKWRWVGYIMLFI
jgi:hypothetical protein